MIIISNSIILHINSRKDEHNNGYIIPDPKYYYSVVLVLWEINFFLYICVVSSSVQDKGMKYPKDYLDRDGGK